MTLRYPFPWICLLLCTLQACGGGGGGSGSEGPPTPASATGPSITKQPLDASVVSGAGAEFNVAASGAPSPAYQWQSSTDGDNWVGISGANGAGYSIASTNTAQTGTYFRVSVQNNAGAVVSTAAILTVSAAAVAPTITSQPASTTVTAPALASFSVAATGAPLPMYQWQVNQGGGWQNLSGATAASYVTAATDVSQNSHQYRVVLTNSAGVLTSSAAVLSVNSSAPSSTERQILATTTDATISPTPSAGEAAHVAINPSPSVSQAGKLLVFIPGTQGVPSQYRYILRAGASRGFHAIGVNYPNQQAMGTLCQASVDPDCYWKARREVITGINYSTLITVSSADSIINRLQQLLTYLNAQQPNEGWGQYLSSGKIDWSKVVLAGHSQGGGHVGVLAKLVALNRAVYFSSPEDWVSSSDTPASWTTKTNVTPAAQQYGFGSDRDTLVPNAHASAIWNNFGMYRPPGGMVSVDTAVSPYENSHQLHTNAAPNPASTAPTLTLMNHGITVVDTSTPVDGFGNSLFDSNSVWAYLCFQ